jgi:DNA-binding PadR family transcriptional regulator
LAPGTVQPILIRFEGVEWLESWWEDVDPADVGRPRRRYYRLTHEGAELARNAIARAEQMKLISARRRESFKPILGGAS